MNLDNMWIALPILLAVVLLGAWYWAERNEKR